MIDVAEPSPTSTPRSARTISALAAGVAVLALLSLLVGPAGFGWPEVAPTLILFEIRLPRTLLALLIGGTLGLAGAVLQGYLRNALAEPALIGVSGGAGLGAVIAIHSGAAATLGLALPLGGLIGAGLAMLLVLALAGQRSGPLPLILAGVAVSSLSAALISAVLSLSRNPFATVEIVHWMLGSLADRSLLHVWLAGPFMLAGWALLLVLGRGLDALTLGEDAARNLGFDLDRVRLFAVAGIALSVGAATAVAGMIGFVGLVVPHVLRPLVEHRPAHLLPASVLGGAMLLLASDIALRLLTPAGELRLGVLTAFIGAPFFLWLIADNRRSLAP